AQGDLYQYPDLYVIGDVDWNGFQSFTPGQYRTRYLDFAMVLATIDPNTICYDLEFVITVTIPALILNIAVSTSTGATAVTFASPFNGGAGAGNTPVVQATIINASAGDDVFVTSVTRTGLNVAVKSAGSFVARTVYLQVEGF